MRPNKNLANLLTQAELYLSHVLRVVETYRNLMVIAAQGLAFGKRPRLALADSTTKIRKPENVRCKAAGEKPVRIPETALGC